MAASCLADGFAYGRWQHVRGIKDGESLRERNELGPKTLQHERLVLALH